MLVSTEMLYVAAAVELLVVAAHVLVIGSVLLARRRDPSATLAWILFIALVPIVGVVLYLAFGRVRIRRARKRTGRAERRVRTILSRHDVPGRLLGARRETLEERTQTQLALGNALASTPASQGNTACVLHDADVTYQEILAAIDGARDHVHVEFYIVQPDAVGETLRDRLAQRAAEGIEVRVLCDAIGSMALPRGFWRPLRDAGGHAAFFAPALKLVARLRRRDRLDYRNHRKVVVVDGRIGFTGGINVGKEYLGLDPRIGRWRDTHMRIEGPAVLSLQQTFLQDWLLTTAETLDDARYLPDCPARGDCVVQVIDSGPDQAWPTMELYYAQAIAQAQDRVWITNPYFIPSAAVQAALTVTALRGVDVRLLLPSRSDSRLVTQASRSYYGELLESGVRIFEYGRGFVHAKTMVVDDWVATVGSANMDMRSFNLNYELNAFVFGAGVCRDIAAQFAADLDSATEVTPETVGRTSLPSRLAQSVARLLSPLL